MTTIHNLTPSPLRTIVLQGRNGTVSQVILSPKSSADCLDYTLDFSAILAGTDDTPATIKSTTLTATGDAYELKAMWSTVSGTMVVVFLASGQPDTTQKILFEITTQQGRVYSVMAVLQITALTGATAPPSDFTADTLTNGKVLIADTETLPSGYSSNGRVVMATEAAAPIGTPSFESVTAGTYSGDGSGLNVISSAKIQTIGQWIAALSSGGTQGVEIKAINVTQGAVVAGQSSTVTLIATLTDGTTTAPVTFDVPAGSPGTQGLQGNTGATGTDGKDGQTGPAGVGIASVAVSQSPVTAGQPSTVTLTATMTNGETAPGVSFQAPPGADGGATDFTAAAINTALGYTAANGTDYLPLQMASISNIPTLSHPSDAGSNPSLFSMVDATKEHGINIGFTSNNNYNRFTILSQDNFPPCLTLQDNYGYGGYLFLKTVSGNNSLASPWFGIDGTWGESGIMWVEKDSDSGVYWKISCPSTSTQNAAATFDITASNSDNTKYLSTPAVSISKATNQATLATEPVILAYNAYTFTTLPASPVAWQRVVVTDKAIGSGSQGVMAMWNPNTKAWTGLSGETLV